MLHDFAPDVPHRENLWETVAARLRQAIITGRLAPGVHLQEQTLEAKFRVSKMSVRQALVQLEREGIVRNEPRRGAFVVGITPADVRRIYDLRELLELRAARLVAEAPDPDGLGRLGQLVADMRRVAETGRGEQFAALDLAFHRQLVASAGDRWLLAAWDVIAGVVATLLEATDVYTDHPGGMPGLVDPHQRLLDTLVAREPAAA